MHLMALLASAVMLHAATACTDQDDVEFDASDYFSSWTPSTGAKIPQAMQTYLTNNGVGAVGFDLSKNRLTWEDEFPNYELKINKASSTGAHIFSYNYDGTYRVIASCPYYQFIEKGTGETWFTEAYDWELHKAKADQWRYYTSESHYFSGSKYFEFTPTYQVCNQLGLSSSTKTIEVRIADASEWIIEPGEEDANLIVSTIKDTISCYRQTIKFEYACKSTASVYIYYSDPVSKDDITWTSYDYATFVSGKDGACTITLPSNTSSSSPRTFSFRFKQDDSYVWRTVVQAGRNW
jgi:hypothetical protein